MTDKEFIQMTAECVRGEHGTAARLAAGTGYLYAGLLGVVASGFRRFVNDVDEACTTHEEQRIMDLLTLPLGKRR